MQDKHSDHNLLIGILAVQLDFITRDQLVKAMMDWVVDKKRSIDEIFVKQGLIDVTTQELIRALVEKHLKNHGDDPQQSLAAISSVEQSLKDELKSINDSEIEASLQAIPSRDAVESPEVSAMGFGTTVSFTGDKGESRYRVVRPHARGGLGEVHVAYDNELNREVALKEILDQHADQPDSRARFLAEAEVTGGLEHPGIVPVYGLGTYDNGRPFYAMRFIKGDSLKTAVDEFHDKTERNARKRSFQGVEFRDLLGRFIDVCNAIEYAHARGVLHRDLKPGNIMVGKYGETLVVDWGLSKVVGKPEISSFDDERTLRPASASGSAPTQMGSALGTPQYMSPEQAAGQLDQLGPASDVYSLGATLYYLLVGTSPFARSNRDEIGQLLSDVQNGRFMPPIELNSNVPAELDAICRKAMSKRPEDRFLSAKNLGSEVEKWLADEPVDCFDEPWTSKLGRVVRQNQVSVVAASVTLVLITAGMIIYSGIMSRNNSVLSRKNVEIQNQSDEISRVNGELSEANVKLKESFENERLRFEAESRQALAETRLAKTFVGRSHRLCVDGDVDDGLRLLAKTLEQSPDSAKSLHEAIRFSLANWQQRTLFLNHIVDHDRQIRKLVFGKDSDRFLAASLDRTARLWSAESGEPLGPSLAGSHQVEAAVLLGDQQSVVIGCFDGKIKVFDGLSGEQKVEIDAGSLVRDLKVNRDQTIVVARTNSGSLFAFNPENGEELDVTGDLEGVISFDIHPSKNHLVASRYKQKVVTIVDLETKKELTKLEVSDSPRLVKYSPAGDHIVVVAGRPQIYESENLKPVSRLLPQNGVQRIDFQADGKKFVTAGLDGQAIIFSLPDGKVVAPALRHANQVFDSKFSSDGRVVLTTSAGKARLWDAKTGEKLNAAIEYSGVVAFSPSNRKLIAGGLDGDVRIWSVRSPFRPPARLDMDGFIYDAEYHATSQKLVTVGEAKSFKIWDLKKSDFQRTVRKGLAPLATIKTDSVMTSVAINPSGSLIAVGGRNKIVKLYDEVGKEVDHSPIEHDGAVQELEFSSDGKILVSGGDDSVLAFWEADSGELIEPIALDGPVRSLAVGQLTRRQAQNKANSKVGESTALSPRNFVVAGGVTNTATVWDLATQKKLFELSHDESARSIIVSVSNNGKWIATGDNNGVLRMWHSENGNQVWEFSGFNQNRKSGSSYNVVAFSPDDELVLVGGYDKIGRVLEVQSGRKLGLPIYHKAAISAASFVFRGRAIVTGDVDGFSQVTHVATGEPIGKMERHRGEITVALAIGERKFLAGHGSLRLTELAPAQDPIEGLREKVSVLTGTEVSDDDVEILFDKKRLLELRKLIKQKPGANTGIFRLHEDQVDDATKAFPAISLSALANPISDEVGPFAKSYISYRVPKKSKK